MAVMTLALISPLGCGRSEPPKKLLQDSRRALIAGDFKQATELVKAIPSSANEWQAAQLIAGEAASKDGRLEDALKIYLNAANKSPSADGRLALFSAAEIYLETGRLVEAEATYREVLKTEPDNGLTNSRLALLLTMTGRRWEALSPFMALIRRGDADYRELSMAADVGLQVSQPDMLEKWNRKNPSGKLVRLAVATHAFDAGAANAKNLLLSIVSDFPELVPAQAMLGELLVEAKDEHSFLHWYQDLPAVVGDAPDIWFVRGLWARKRGDLQVAAECFRRTVVVMPFHRRGYTALGQVLAAMDDPQAEQIVDHSSKMVRVAQLIGTVLLSEGSDEPAVLEVAQLMEQQGRIWEAVAWAVVARDRFPNSNWYTKVFERHSQKLNKDLPQIESEGRNLPQIELAADAGFEDLILNATWRSPAQIPTSRPSAIRFDDTATIPFQYFNGDDPTTEGIRLFEQTGGGVGIIDLDIDGIPDVFLPQGTEWSNGSPHPTPSGKFIDQIFRNGGSGNFSDITEQALRHDSGFGQGCAVGDFNNDGFPDLYVATTGRNCLYKNMGDGSFQDVTEFAGVSDRCWTASAVICDLNADGLPDIFDVNYLSGADVFERICRNRACSPGVFPGASDRLLINQGDGSFEFGPTVTPAVDAKGLGVVVFETDTPRRPCLFVANDQVANFLLKCQPADNPSNIELVNESIVTGVAFNDQGLSMACMGIAIDDFDANGLMDIFTTNFQDEANTLYSQETTGLYRDTTNAAGLLAVSYPFTGWGTQSLDADLDGAPDLVVANGHVDDGRPYGRDYHQRPQVFRNIGGTFQELAASELGEWFDTKQLGRGLARVDMNLDGLPDFIVSNINSPLSVLRNVSAETGHYMRVQLHATRTARDAIGARVAITLGDREVERQLTAGDGYMASSERVVEFGLGQRQVGELRISWPSGATTVLKRPPTDSKLIAAEGLTTATLAINRTLVSLPVQVTRPAADLQPATP